MRTREFCARLGLVLIGIGAVGAPFFFIQRTPLIHARVAESGGWTPDSLQAVVGQPLKLRLTSDDVVHGFAVGQMDMPEATVLPGKVTDVTLLFQEPGTYVFYCTRWCGIDHWRMRGTIEVSGLATATEPVTPPLYVALGLDLDAPRSTRMAPITEPVAALPAGEMPTDLAPFLSEDYYRSHSPSATWNTLRKTDDLSQFTDQQLWDMTAWIWRSNTTPDELADGRDLYARNCAACHGEAGRGDGVFADQLASGVSSSSGMGTQWPAAFSDASRMLAASPALLQGKILRGGMGTGMPSWGQIFTGSQTWDLVAYLYSFHFSYP